MEGSTIKKEQNHVFPSSVDFMVSGGPDQSSLDRALFTECAPRPRVVGLEVDRRSDRRPSKHVEADLERSFTPGTTLKYAGGASAAAEPHGTLYLSGEAGFDFKNV